MRTTLAAAALAIFAAAPAMAQPVYGGAIPPGSYQRQCTNLRMEGQFLHGVCRGAHGGGESSINVQSCSTGIFVDDSGALACIGPGGGAPPQVRAAPPGYSTGQPTYDRGYQDRGYQDRGYQDRGYQDRGYQDRGYQDRGYQDRGRTRGSAMLFDRRDYRGGSFRVTGPAVDLNARVRSIQLDRRSGPWTVCSDPGFRGRCVTIRDSVADVRRLGLRDIGSLRPE